MNTITGFLLSYIKYGDNDAILHCFTLENGHQSFFVKGIYNPKNKKKAYLSPLNEVQLELLPKNKSALPTVTKIHLINQVNEPNMIESCILFFIADFLNQILKNEDNVEHLYFMLSEFIKEIKNKNYQAHIIVLFICIKIFGFSPLISEDKFLNPLSGCFSHHRSHDCFDADISAIWKKILASKNEYNIKINNHLKRKTLESLLIYFEVHFPNFKRPLSLDVLQQIFND